MGGGREGGDGLRGPRSPQDGSRGPQEGRKTAQEASKTAQEGPKRGAIDGKPRVLGA